MNELAQQEIGSNNEERLFLKFLLFCTDPILKKTFLITYRSFTEPAELLKQLMQRFGLDFGGKPPGEEGDKISGAATPPLPSSEEEAEKVLQKRRIKVVGVLKSWLEYYFYDFGLDKDLMDMLESFLQDICVIMKGAGPHLKKMLDRGNRYSEE